MGCSCLDILRNRLSLRSREGLQVHTFKNLVYLGLVTNQPIASTPTAGPRPASAQRSRECSTFPRSASRFPSPGKEFLLLVEIGCASLSSTSLAILPSCKSSHSFKERPLTSFSFPRASNCSSRFPLIFRGSEYGCRHELSSGVFVSPGFQCNRLFPSAVR